MLSGMIFNGFHKGIFSNETNFDNRYIKNEAAMKKFVNHSRGLGLKIVLTSGTYDMAHIGHARYFGEAKKHGDILIVGVDSDEKVRARKGPDRPVVPEAERLEMVCHLRPVDAVFLKHYKSPKWNLIKMVRPDVLIATKETYDKGQLQGLKKYCGKVVVLNPQATTSTSAKLRRLQIGMASKFEKTLLPKMMTAVEQALKEIKG
ncbi:MAG: hypothetical protein A2836_03810 [Candidatus Taylorbacteria bacterium RIFCSPHIGHO2_01_FULL_45_63]|nr:MAG: hypothetical protein A2836_03810 [Candidatus Taylorbacteria bacterium RIFCSPHIGHO2_01_FULL_45_63]OHA34351.1 MAG: hypothetical protein A3A22_00510 [Candidatus Taylorbacteria bacterium RIFCSPLOWO2_01_FULL_45_34b]